MCSSFFLFFIIIIGDLLMFFTLHPKCSASWFCLSFGLNFALYTDMQLADVVAVYETNLRKKKHKLELEMRQQRMVYIWTSQNSENAKFPYIHDCIQAKINSISM